jgi:DNA-binding MarR family transcriptional regulator
VSAANDVAGAIKEPGQETFGPGRQATCRPTNRERAQTLFNQRRDRSRSFGDHAKIFQEAAWDILLELYLCHEDGRIPSTTGVAYGAGVPITTALRSLKKFERSGLIDSWMDPADTRVRRIRMTPHAVNMMLRYLDGI